MAAIEPENKDLDVEKDEWTEIKTFKELGLNTELCQACKRMGWTTPTAIQQKAIPVGLQGKDVIGLAETGSGKTAAFALPIIHTWAKEQRGLFALILTPTRELALQIQEQFDALGKWMTNFKTVVILGGKKDEMKQAVQLALKPAIIIATPGRLCEHLLNTKGFRLKRLGFLVMDEADKILDMDFEDEVNKILHEINEDRTTFLFSATMSKKVGKLIKRASLKSPESIEVSSHTQIPASLKQFCMMVKQSWKELLLVDLLAARQKLTSIVFSNTCLSAERLALTLRYLGFRAIALHGQMEQAKRVKTLAKFKAKEYNVLVATDLASRGLDIPHVDVVINFDLPKCCKDYVHRVGRAARAGRKGQAYTFFLPILVEVQRFSDMGKILNYEIPMYNTKREDILRWEVKVQEARKKATKDMSELEKRTNQKRGRDVDDNNDEDEFKPTLAKKRKK